jgi:hypothetical protein
MQEKENITYILDETIKALKKEDVLRLRDLSNRTIHSSSIYSDGDNITVAVIVYALSKITERQDYKLYPGWKEFIKSTFSCLDSSLLALKKDNIEAFRDSISCIRKNINKISGKLKGYIQDVFRRAEVNKASRMYEHGISMEQTANLLGISLWELQEYAGNTGISDVDLSITMDERKRIKQALEMFEK